MPETERAPGWRALLRPFSPLGRMWDSNEPMDAYGLVHMASAAGDALVAIALADSVFFSVPVSQAKIKVALYLGLTMAPLAVAAPVLVPLLDRTGLRRVISFGAAAGRAAAAIYAAPRFSSLLLFPLAFVLLVLSRIHAITKNGLTMAYAPAHEGLVRANARLGRLAVAAPPRRLLLLRRLADPAGPVQCGLPCRHDGRLANLLAGLSDVSGAAPALVSADPPGAARRAGDAARGVGCRRDRRHDPRRGRRPAGVLLRDAEAQGR